MDARAAAALSLFKRAGLPVEVLDELHWRIMHDCLIQPLALDRGYLFGPATAAMEAEGLGDRLRICAKPLQAVASPSGHFLVLGAVVL